MNELIDARRTRSYARWHFMVGVSVATLQAVVGLSGARAEDVGRPTIWIELGGQLERVDGGQERFAPSFLSEGDANGFTSPLVVQKPPRYANGFEGSLSFQPEESSWMFSAAIRYGRSNGNRKLHEERPAPTAHQIASAPLLGLRSIQTVTADTRRYSDTTVNSGESHTIIDFQIGKDVGLGLFGKGLSSFLSAGVRFAQFESQSAVGIGEDPDLGFTYKYATQFFGIPGYFKLPLEDLHLNRSTAEIKRSFYGVGPAVGWGASALVVGDPGRAELTFDWGVNGALLFGRQKVNAHHETHTYHHYQTFLGVINTVATTAPPDIHDTARSRSVIVPNLGGFAGLSLKFPSAKVSLGYRADFFFGAMDGGIDTRKTYDRSFYGPFATVSIGLP